MKIGIKHSSNPFNGGALEYDSERTAGARDVINNAGPMIQAAIEEIPEDKILRIADFGAADGGTSNQMWDKCNFQNAERLVTLDK